MATETGKLLSGLADDMGGPEGEEAAAHEEGEGDEDGEDGLRKTKKRVSFQSPFLKYLLTDGL